MHPRRKINYQYSPTDSSAGDAAPAAAEAVGLPGASEAHLGDVLGAGCGWCSILGTSRSRSIPYNSIGSQRDVLARPCKNCWAGGAPQAQRGSARGTELGFCPSEGRPTRGRRTATCGSSSFGGRRTRQRADDLSPPSRTAALRRLTWTCQARSAPARARRCENPRGQTLTDEFGWWVTGIAVGTVPRRSVSRRIFSSVLQSESSSHGLWNQVCELYGRACRYLAGIAHGEGVGGRLRAAGAGQMWAVCCGRM